MKYTKHKCIKKNIYFLQNRYCIFLLSFFFLFICRAKWKNLQKKKMPYRYLLLPAQRWLQSGVAADAAASCAVDSAATAAGCGRKSWQLLMVVFGLIYLFFPLRIFLFLG